MLAHSELLLEPLTFPKDTPDLHVQFFCYILSNVILLAPHAPVHKHARTNHMHTSPTLSLSRPPSFSAVSTACVLMLGMMNYGEGTCAAGFTAINKTSACSSRKEKGAGKAGLGLIESASSPRLPFQLQSAMFLSLLPLLSPSLTVFCVLSGVLFGSRSLFHALTPPPNSLSDVTPLSFFQAEPHCAAQLSFGISSVLSLSLFLSLSACLPVC